MNDQASPTKARVALITLGRTRPGFDRNWGRDMQKRCQECVQALFPALVPPHPIVDPNDLQTLLRRVRADRIEVLIFIQPTIADGTHLNEIIHGARDIQMIHWATPENPKSTTVSSNSLVGAHLYAATLRQHGIRCGLVYGHPQETHTRHALQREVALLSTVKRIRTAKIGLIGSHAPGFTDLHVDPRPLAEELGPVVCNIALTELLKYFEAPHKDNLDRYRERIEGYPLRYRGIAKEARVPIIEAQARYWSFFEKTIERWGLSALAHRCWPELPDIIGHWPYLATSCMASEGASVAIEGDVEGALCAVIARGLTGYAPYLTDWLSHTTDRVVLWHGGAIPFRFCRDDQDSPIDVALHFNNQRPAVVETVVSPHRALTLFRVWRCDTQFRMCALEGVSVEVQQPLRGTVCEMQNDDCDIDYWFQTMIRYGMPHHLCVAEGHIASVLHKLCYLVNIEWVQGNV